MQDDARVEFRVARWRLLLSSTGGIAGLPVTDDDLRDIEELIDSDE